VGFSGSRDGLEIYTADSSVTGGWEATVVAGGLTDNLRNCSGNVIKSQSWRSAKVWNPFIRSQSNTLCVPMVAPLEEMVLQSWSESAESVMFVLSDLRIRPRCRPFEVTKVYYINRGQANDR
jgi:hypothetical protein